MSRESFFELFGQEVDAIDVDTTITMSRGWNSLTLRLNEYVGPGPHGSTITYEKEVVGIVEDQRIRDYLYRSLKEIKRQAAKVNRQEMSKLRGIVTWQKPMLIGKCSRSPTKQSRNASSSTRLTNWNISICDKLNTSLLLVMNFDHFCKCPEESPLSHIFGLSPFVLEQSSEESRNPLITPASILEEQMSQIVNFDQGIQDQFVDAAQNMAVANISNGGFEGGGLFSNQRGGAEVGSTDFDTGGLEAAENAICSSTLNNATELYVASCATNLSSPPGWLSEHEQRQDLHLNAGKSELKYNAIPRGLTMREFLSLAQKRVDDLEKAPALPEAQKSSGDFGTAPLLDDKAIIDLATQLFKIDCQRGRCERSEGMVIPEYVDAPFAILTSSLPRLLKELENADGPQTRELLMCSAMQSFGLNPIRWGEKTSIFPSVPIGSAQSIMAQALSKYVQVCGAEFPQSLYNCYSIGENKLVLDQNGKTSVFNNYRPVLDAGRWSQVPACVSACAPGPC